MKYIILPLLILYSNLVFSQNLNIPEKTNNYINDFADILDNHAEASLREISKAIELESSAQVVIITTNDIPEDYSIEEYSIKLAQSWGIGQKATNNGLLILICPNIRKSRIEVGYGLEGVLTDAYTKQLQVNYFRPNFKTGNYYNGLLQVLIKIREEISPEAIEQKRQYELQKEKDEKETLNAIGNFFLYFLLYGGLIGLIIYGIVFSIKKKKEKELAEKERKELEILIQKREEERIDTLSKIAINNLNSFINDINNELSEMGDFLNAKSILYNINTLYNNILSDLEKNDKIKHPSICKDGISKINDSVKNIKSNYKIKTDIESSSKMFSENDFEGLQKKSKINLNHLIDDDHVLQLKKKFNNEQPSVLYTKMVHLFNEASHECSRENFDKAGLILSSAIKIYYDYKNLCESINLEKQKLDNVNIFLQNAHKIYEEKIKETNQIYLNSYVSSSNKNKWHFEKSNKLQNFKVNLNSINPYIEEKRIIEIFNVITTFQNIAKNEIDAIENEIKAKRKREQEEQEEKERIARKKREEEDDERRRKRNSESSWSSSSWSSNSDSWSSNSSSSDTSFGGGSFGGGGSSDSW